MNYVIEGLCLGKGGQRTVQFAEFRSKGKTEVAVVDERMEREGGESV